MTTNLPSVLLSLEHQPTLLVGKFMSNLSAAISCNTCTYHYYVYYVKCTVNSEIHKYVRNVPAINSNLLRKGTNRRQVLDEYIENICVLQTRRHRSWRKKEFLNWYFQCVHDGQIDATLFLFSDEYVNFPNIRLPVFPTLIREIPFRYIKVRMWRDLSENWIFGPIFPSPHRKTQYDTTFITSSII